VRRGLRPGVGQRAARRCCRALTLLGCCAYMLRGRAHAPARFSSPEPPLKRAKNVLSYPIVQRHRYFRVKQRMRAGEGRAVSACMTRLHGKGCGRAVMLG
jgi:hypothetical protein